MSGIFISYRRDDSAAYAGRLYDRLESHFGHDHIFMDIDHIEPGEIFAEVIQKKLGAVDVAIVMIGKQWLDITDSAGQRRLDDPNDFVRLEITAVLERKIRVIPVLVGGAVVPKKPELPDPLVSLADRHAFEISDARFRSDVDKLIQALEKILNDQAPTQSSKKPNSGINLHNGNFWIDLINGQVTKERMIQLNTLSKPLLLSLIISLLLILLAHAFQ